MVLRCATAMVVDGNTFNEIDWWVYDIFTDDKFSSNVNGLAITRNTLNQGQKVYSLAVDPLASKLVIDANRIRFTGPIFANYADGSTSPNLADWRRRTGMDLATTTY